MVRCTDPVSPSVRLGDASAAEGGAGVTDARTASATRRDGLGHNGKVRLNGGESSRGGGGTKRPSARPLAIVVVARKSATNSSPRGNIHYVIAR
jgi:hypothetical protein